MSAITSNAFNFSGFIDSGVDVRTGTYSASINIMDLKGNHLSGPDFNFSLHYNMNNTSDEGFGRNWSVPISRFSKSTGLLSLSNGQAFKIQYNASLGRYEIPYRKLEDIKVYYVNTPGTQSGEIKVVHKGGEMEFIDWDKGVINRRYSPQGHKLKYEYGYLNNQPILWKVSDEVGSFMVVDWWSDPYKTTVELNMAGELVKTVTITKTANGSYKRLSHASIPNDTSLYTSFGYEWVDSLGVDLLVSVVYPTGLEETVRYQHEGHRLQSGAPIPYMPYVTELYVDHGEGQEPAIHRFSYSSQNYLGFGSDAVFHSGEDTLFGARKDYVYSCTERVGNELEIIKHYNKYHLLIRDEFYKDGQKYQEADYEYYADANTHIEYQPAQYGMLKACRTQLHQDGNTREQLSQYEYDIWGNEIWSRDEQNVETRTEYYSEKGEEGCPASKYGFRNRVKHVDLLSRDGKQNVRKLFKYITLDARLDDEKFFLLQEEQVGVLKRTFSFYSNPNDLLNYGRVKAEREIVNGAVDEKTCVYQINGNQLVIGNHRRAFDGTYCDNEEYFSLTDGLTTCVKDSSHQSIDIETNNVGAVVQEKVYSNGSLAAFRRFLYQVGRGNNVTSEYTSGQPTLHFYSNNAGKVIRVELEETTGGRYTLSGHRYNSQGQLVSTRNNDWQGSKKVSLLTRYEYDQWGNVLTTFHPDGTIEYNHKDPVALVNEHWIEGLNKSVQSFDLEGNVTRKAVYDAKGVFLFDTLYQYDSLRRLSQMTTSRGATIDFEYDEFDRIVLKLIRADGQLTREEHRYADNTTEDRLEAILVNGIEIGSRTFDGLGRITREYRNGGEYLHRYSSRNKPDSTTTPSGQTINYYYHPTLDEIVGSEVEGDSMSAQLFTYDGATGHKLGDKNANASNEYIYNALGQMVQEATKLAGNQSRSAHYHYTLMGTLMSSTDAFGGKKNLVLDDLGRPVAVSFHQDEHVATIHVGYDDFGRPVSYIMTDDENCIEQTITYNDQGKEAQRRSIHNGIEVSVTDYEYDNTLRMVGKRTLSAEGSTIESMGYDQLGRLTRYQCSGSHPVRDRKGKSIRSQTFTYDAFNNITAVATVFEDSSSNNESHIFDSVDPMKLQEVRNSHPDYANIQLKYDAHGNQQVDCCNNQYEFNARDQLQTVYAPDGTVINPEFVS